jgi:tetratricopeptide (TPR) repeat protein
MNDALLTEQYLDDFIKGNLSKERIKQLLTDNGYADATTEIELHQSAAIAIQRFSTISQVEQIHKEFFTSAETVKKQPGKTIAMFSVKTLMRAASVLLFLAAGFIIYEIATLSGDKIHRDIYQSFSLNTGRDIKEVSESIIIRQFRQNNFKAVIKSYTEIVIAGNREKFLAGYAYMQTNNYKEGISLMEAIIDSNKNANPPLYNDEAEYYLALAYLKTGANNKAYKYLSIIHNDINHTYHEKISWSVLIKSKWLK